MDEFGMVFPGFGEVKKNLADGVYDGFQAVIECRKMGISFCDLDAEIDSWGGVPPALDYDGPAAEFCRLLT
jgi:hypothetical protein